jgi:hypothetical protein
MTEEKVFATANEAMFAHRAWTGGRVLVVDGMNFARRCQVGLGSSRDGFLFNCVRNLRAEVQLHGPDLVLVAWEGNPVHRKTAHPGYKQTRRETAKEGERESFYSLVHTLRSLFLDHLPLWQVWHPLYEADDLMGALPSRLGEGGELVISSTDGDMAQALEVPTAGRVRVWDPRAKSDRVLPEGRSCLLEKVLAGDAGDDIPALVTPAPARKLAADTAQLLAWLEAGGEERKREWDRNMLLVEFARPDLVLDRARLFAHRGVWDPLSLRTGLREIGAPSLYGDPGWPRQEETWAGLDGR